MKTYIYVHRQTIAKNTREGTLDPATRLHCEGRDIWCHNVTILGKTRLVSSPHQTLKGAQHGVRYWIETESEVYPEPALLFVGENRSPKAKEMGVTWEDGRLSAKVLFEALEFSGYDPKRCSFTNWFEEGGPGRVSSWKGVVVSLGNKVHKALNLAGIHHLPIVHPAARGKIRTRNEYNAHVSFALVPLLQPFEPFGPLDRWSNGDTWTLS